MKLLFICLTCQVNFTIDNKKNLCKININFYLSIVMFSFSNIVLDNFFNDPFEKENDFVFVDSILNIFKREIALMNIERMLNNIIFNNIQLMDNFVCHFFDDDIDNNILFMPVSTITNHTNQVINNRNINNNVRDNTLINFSNVENFFEPVEFSMPRTQPTLVNEGYDNESDYITNALIEQLIRDTNEFDNLVRNNPNNINEEQKQRLESGKVVNTLSKYMPNIDNEVFYDDDLYSFDKNNNIMFDDSKNETGRREFSMVLLEDIDKIQEAEIQKEELKKNNSSQKEQIQAEKNIQEAEQQFQKDFDKFLQRDNMEFIVKSTGQKHIKGEGIKYIQNVLKCKSNEVKILEEHLQPKAREAFEMFKNGKMEIKEISF